MCKGQSYNLGEENAATNLVIGTNPGSVIPLMDEDADGEFFRIRYRRGKFEIKNLSPGPLTINDVTLKKGRKRDVLLPATIQVSDELKIEIYREVIELDEQDTEPTVEAISTAENL